jgi:DNA-binding MarR family transcriptional regulator
VSDWIDTLLEGWPAVRDADDLTAYAVTGRIARIAAHLARNQEEVFGGFGLNRAEVGVLSALRSAGAGAHLSPTFLFKGLMLSSAGMTSILDRLERRRLVQRRPDPTDRRAVRISLTEKGSRLVEAAVTANAERERRLLASLSPADAKRLARVLKNILAELEPDAR